MNGNPACVALLFLLEENSGENSPQLSDEWKELLKERKFFLSTRAIYQV
jgi:hypothetical protein